MFLTGLPVDRSTFAVGWCSLATLEHYIREAAAFRFFGQISPIAAVFLSRLTALFAVAAVPPGELGNFAASLCPMAHLFGTLWLVGLSPSPQHSQGCR